MKKLATVLCLLLHVLAGSGADKHVTVIRAAYYGSAFTTSREALAARLDSAATYFESQFANGTRFAFHLAADAVLPQAQAYYGANTPDRRDALGYKAVAEACQAVDGSVDFRATDCVFIIFPGIGEDKGGGENSIWPQFGKLSDDSATLSLDGKKLDPYCLMCEDADLGTICHEYGHALGLPDFYDTDGAGSGGVGRAMWGSLALMDEGRRNNSGNTPPCLNAVERHLLGIGGCSQLQEGKTTLQPIGNSGSYLIAGTEENCILLECRGREGYDKHIGGYGLLAYSIDKSGNPAGWSDYYRRDLTAAERWERGQINCNPDHQCATIVPAKKYASSVADVFFPQSGATDYCPEGSELALTDIQIQADGSVSFEVIRPISSIEVQAFQNAAIVRWSTHPYVGGSRFCEVAWWPSGERHKADSCLAKYPCCHSMDGLASGTEYRVEIRVRSMDGKEYRGGSSFRTQVRNAGGVPFICLSTAKRNSDGSFVAGSAIPLKINGAEKVARTDWYMNGDPISAGSDGMWQIPCSGLLKAIVWWEDGGHDVFEKEVTLR